MREKAEIFFDAVTCVREALVEEAQSYVFRRRIRWQRYLGAAACLVLALCLGLFGLLAAGGSGGSSGAPNLNGAAPPQSADSVFQGPADAPSGDTEPSCPPSETGEPAQVRFTAVVREVHEAWLLVEAEEAFASPEERIEVPLEEVTDLPALSPGDRVAVICASVVHDPSGAVRAEGVQEIARLDGR